MNYTTQPHGKLPMGDFFGFKHHPFADTYGQRQLFLPERDSRQIQTIKRLLHSGKSLALCGPSGSGKTTLVHALLQDLDKKTYRSVLLPYAGHSRNGIARILAETLGVDTKGRGIPLIARTQQYIEAMIDGANPRHPVIIVDDAQRLENDSLWDLSSLLFQTGKPSSAASLLLVGDETLARRLDLHILSPIRSRLTGIIKTQYLNEYESRLFIEHRLKNAAAPANLFEKDAIEIIAASTRGNRRALMNTATMALEEGYYHEQKTITAEILYNSEWFNESE
jgi:type II secretory pathway predicted ATPase ExeA